MSIKIKTHRALLIIAALAILFCPASIQATVGDQPVNIYLFWTKGCPHCAAEKEYLAQLAGRDRNLKIVTLELIESRDNRELFRKVGEELRANVSGVPFTVVGERYFIGWLDEERTGAAIAQAVAEARRTQAPDVVAGLQAASASAAVPPEQRAIPEKLPLPFFGEIEIKYLSLGLITLIIGLLDGFNPCAMWVLIFLINLLLGMEDRRKMWILGGTFILASAVIYFLFMTAWLNFLVFVGFIVWVRIGIGAVALLAGFYNLREYVTERARTCMLEEAPRRRRTDGKDQGRHPDQKILAGPGGHHPAGHCRSIWWN